MKTVGIIAEYNPFHNGHQYQIEKAKSLTGADRVIIVMSGNFMQRGTPALLDKYLRTNAALSCGADLVLELPVYYSCSSAEYFARGAVCLLNRLGVVDTLCFGSECGDIRRLTYVASALQQETPAFSNSIKAYLKAGYTFPQARTLALEHTLEGSSSHTEMLSAPNNILGIEYIRALLFFNSSIQPYTIQRIGSAYHEKRLMENNSSATAIRKSLAEYSSMEKIKNQIPCSVYDSLLSSYNKTFPVFTDEFSAILHYKLLLESEIGFTAYADVSDDLSSRIQNHISQYYSFLNFCDLLKTKDITYSRISRCLLHIMLDIKKEHMTAYCNSGMIFYARMLGFRKDSADLLNAIKTNASIPLISKLADAGNYLKTSNIGRRMLSEDIRTAHIYDAIVQNKFKNTVPNEYTRNIVIYPS